jgi:hypothetical protein
MKDRKRRQKPTGACIAARSALMIFARNLHSHAVSYKPINNSIKNRKWLQLLEQGNHERPETNTTRTTPNERNRDKQTNTHVRRTRWRVSASASRRRSAAVQGRTPPRPFALRAFDKSFASNAACVRSTHDNRQSVRVCVRTGDVIVQTEQGEKYTTP